MGYSRRSRAVKSAVRSPIWSKFELMQALTLVLVTCKYEEDPFETEGTSEITKFLPLYVYRCFSRRSRSAYSACRNPIWSNFELMQAFMVILATCKNEEDPIKMKALEF